MKKKDLMHRNLNLTILTFYHSSSGCAVWLVDNKTYLNCVCVPIWVIKKRL